VLKTVFRLTDGTSDDGTLRPGTPGKAKDIRATETVLFRDSMLDFVEKGRHVIAQLEFLGILLSYVFDLHPNQSPLADAEWGTLDDRENFGVFHVSHVSPSMKFIGTRF
jgi:hypothetical protein